MNELKSKVMDVYRKSVNRNSDLGSCVLGYNLLVDGVQIVPQPFQGSSGCYNVYSDVTDYLISIGIDESRISIKYGVMD